VTGKIERHGVSSGATTGHVPPFAKVVRAGDFVFVSGQVPLDENGRLVTGDIGEQTHQTIRNIQALLGTIGLDLTSVVKVTAWLEDTRDFGVFNRVYAEYFGNALPARSCVRADMMIDCKVEIEAIAYAPV
jgi:2-iminobutanoate/2-iminopropanoate deaminase